MKDAETITPTATLDEVDILAELERRPRRAPNYEAEREAVAVLTAEMSSNPRNVLQKLVEIAVPLCEAGTAGISLIDGDVFRWEAVAGVFADARGGTMPRYVSPCAVCIDRGATQLMRFPDRCFPALLVEPRFVEALLIPFYDHGLPIGTVWIVSHTIDRRFDKEDERIVRVLAQFAAAGWQLWRAADMVATISRRHDDFLATLGHELRNPLSAIGSAVSVLHLRTFEPSVTRAVAIIARQTQHVIRLADDILDVARSGSSKLHLEWQTVDLCLVVAETVETRRLQAERRHQTLTFDRCEDPVWLEADPMRLAQIVSNLVDNATKYTPEGGCVAVSVSRWGDEVLVDVQDDGPGIPADRLQTIFEPFTQLHNSRDTFGGLGLGLALVRRLTELHGGVVSVVSNTRSLGSCFTVRLPIRRTVA